MSSQAVYSCKYFSQKPIPVEPADEVIKRVCINAEWYHDNKYGRATEIYVPCGDEEKYAYEIEGKRYTVIHSNPYADLKKSYDRQKNKQLSLFDY